MRTPLIRKRDYIYSDFDKDLTLNSVNSDITTLKNEAAIKEAIKNLVMTNKGERLFNPELGSNIRAMLFENMTPDTLLLIKDMIQTVIRNYEPRANLIDVLVTSLIDDNQIEVTIVYNAQTQEEPVTLNIILTRIR